MKYQATTALRKLLALRKRIRVLQGGTSSSKTISALLFLIAKAQEDRTPTLTSVVSESLPHLKKGAIRDFLSIMEGHGYYDDSRWNRTDFTYTMETGSKIEFFSADQPDKVRGPRRDRLFLNETNNISFGAFDQLEVRTKEFVIMDFNPVAEFWLHTDVLGQRDDIDHIILTYKDNEGLPPEIIAAIEQRKKNKAWWRVYGEGLLGASEGRIYTDWQIIDEIPHEARLERYGLDFGYTNDPTAIVALYRYNGGYIADEVCYQRGLKNREIADLLKNLPQALVVADSAEPKSIDEIREHGINIIPATKGAGSIQQGIAYVQDQKMSITKRSVNGIKEYRNYLWDTDRESKPINEPVPGNDHLLDALRYAFSNKRPSESILKELHEAARLQVRMLAPSEGLPTIS